MLGPLDRRSNAPLQPPIQQHFVGENGQLWLRREDTGDPAFEWILLDPSGQPRGRLRLPRRTRVVWSDAASFWAVEPDDFDVPWLIRYRITGSMRGQQP